MKVKRLKDLIFEYDKEDSLWPFSVMLTNNVDSGVAFSKREALSFIKWALLEEEWSSKELEPIYKQLKSVFINLKE